jgi:Transposase IS4
MHYDSIDRKPESGCELQNTGCGNAGVLRRLKLVVSAEDEAASHASHPEILHGTKLLTDLVRPWAGSVRVICADSYFASIQAAEQLLSRFEVYCCR